MQLPLSRISILNFRWVAKMRLLYGVHGADSSVPGALPDRFGYRGMLLSCCGARHLRRRQCGFLSCRPRPLAPLPASATGGGRFAPQICLHFCCWQKLRKSATLFYWGAASQICLHFAPLEQNRGSARSSPRRRRSSTPHLHYSNLSIVQK